ncbi:MAG: PKD domain-containing protein [Bacteroidia bacterium]|nr:PKD domain-containing protein [Bacteroidia bacterium]
MLQPRFTRVIFLLILGITLFASQTRAQAPVANWSAAYNNLQIAFLDASTNFPTSWLWDLGDGNTSTQQNPVHQYAVSGSFTVCLIATNAFGSDTLCQQINIFCPVNPTVANFTFYGAAMARYFTDQSTQNPTFWQWDFGDGSTSTQQNPSHLYASPGIYTVCLIVTNVCTTDTLCQLVGVNCPPPVANYSSSLTGLTCQFTDLSTNSPTSWYWDFGDGFTSTQQNPSHTYAAPGTYTVVLQAYNPCGSDTIAPFLTINCPAQPTAAYNYNNTLLQVAFTDQSTGPVTSWLWDFGDGAISTQQNPTHVYTYYGYYTTCLMISNSCYQDTICQTFTLSCPPLTANYSYTNTGLNYQFTDQSTGSPFLWTWEFGDGTVSSLQNPTHLYTTNNSSFNACLIVDNGCMADTICQPITTNCTNVVDIGPDSVLLGPGDTLSLSNTTSSGTFNWSTGETTSSIQLHAPWPAQNPFMIILDHTLNFCPGADTVWIQVDSSCVWPGDINYDLIADNNDLLALGVAYGASGSMRANASINYTCQPAWDWSGAFAGGPNYKHADCNGDGLADSLDIPAISQNYGLVHTKTHSLTKGGPNSPVLYIDTLSATVNPGDPVALNINLGRDTLPADSVYGIAFTLNYDPAIIDTNSAAASFGTCWIGTAGTNLITLSKDFWSSGRIEVALVRTDHQDQMGYGPICQIGLVINDDIAAKTNFLDTLDLFFTNVRLITSQNLELLVNTEGQTTYIAETNHQNPPQNGDQWVEIYPNPAKDQLNLRFSQPNPGFKTLQVFDLSGRQVIQITLQPGQIRTTIPCLTWKSGLYNLVLTGNTRSISRKIQVLR